MKNMKTKLMKDGLLIIIGMYVICIAIVTITAMIS